jgi:hypothetical protein
MRRLAALLLAALARQGFAATPSPIPSSGGVRSGIAARIMEDSAWKHGSWRIPAGSNVTPLDPNPSTLKR